MQANIVDAVLAPAAAADECTGTTDGGGYLSNGRSGENISLDAVVKVIGIAAVMVIVALAAVVELLVQHAVMEAWVLLVSGTSGNSTWRIKVWHRQQ